MAKNWTLSLIFEHYYCTYDSITTIFVNNIIISNGNTNI